MNEHLSDLAAKLLEAGMVPKHIERLHVELDPNAPKDPNVPTLPDMKERFRDQYTWTQIREAYKLGDYKMEKIK